ncbi:MAG: bifunctional 4-hydroxy-2-oxoglutarate aldolase/2-dehydro-3-deoxy-phosphogluconate aldolase [Acidimicrobiia bacterium]
MTVFERLGSHGVLPVVELDRAADAVPLGEALAAGGLPCLEITFRTDAAVAAVERLRRALPELLVAAGTVRTVDEARRAADAGAHVVVSPGLDRSVVAWCLDRGLPVLPGVQTPTEVMAATALGLDVLKFFPARIAGGPDAVAALAGPFPTVRFVPTGGIGSADLGAYLRLPTVIACGGTWLADRAAIADGDFGRVTRLAADAAATVADVRRT